MSDTPGDADNRAKLAGHLRQSLSARVQRLDQHDPTQSVDIPSRTVDIPSRTSSAGAERKPANRANASKKGPLLPGAIGIGFEDALVEAIVAGAKRVTRRPVRPQPALVSATASDWVDEFQNPIVRAFGSVGSTLYVKEKWARDPDGRAILARLSPDGGEPGRRVRWKSPRYMPKEAARLLLHATEVRIERLHELDAASAVLEGGRHVAPDQDPLWWFRETWDRIYAPLGMDWNANPWVWVIGFQPINIDKPLVHDRPTA